MSEDLPSGFYRAEQSYLYNIPESTEFDEWEEAQEEKKTLLKKADDLLESFPFSGLYGYDDLHDAVDGTKKILTQLEAVLDELGRLEDDFPPGLGEPDPDAGHDDPDIGGW